MTDLLGNQVDSSFMNINTAMPQIKPGKLRALVITGDKRSPAAGRAHAARKRREGRRRVLVAGGGRPARPAGGREGQLHKAIVRSWRAGHQGQAAGSGFEWCCSPEDCQIPGGRIQPLGKLISERKITAD
jgi:hypothetical protein